MRSNQLALKHTTLSLKAYYWQDLRKFSQALKKERPYEMVHRQTAEAISILLSQCYIRI